MALKTTFEKGADLAKVCADLPRCPPLGNDKSVEHGRRNRTGQTRVRSIG